MMMDTSLNFLKLQPSKNWFDYFVDRQKLQDLLESPKENESIIVQLADQFMEQVLASEKDASQMQKKLFDDEDMTHLRYKIHDMWMCALSCCAAASWDLDLLSKSSNVIRIRTMFGKLLKFSFAGQLDADSLNQDVFTAVCHLDLSVFSSRNLFPLWLYARWLLVVDKNGRFPAPAAKPTVSNPLNQPDHNLIQAEKLAQAVTELRKFTPDAAQLLKKISELSLDSVEIPGKSCFYMPLDAPSLDVKMNPPMPNLSAEYEPLPMRLFRSKTLYDLMVAHFAARHFVTCKNLLLLVIGDADFVNNSPESVRQLVKIEDAELQGYKQALGISSISRNEVKWEASKATLPTLLSDDGPKAIIKLAAMRESCPPNLCVTAIKQGMCVPRRLMAELREAPFRTEFLEAIAQELSKKTISTQVRSRIMTSLYFLCSLTPDFSNALCKHPKLSQLGKWRQLAVVGCSTTPPPPSKQELDRLSESGPPLWNILTSFNLDVVRAGFDALTIPSKVPYRHHFSILIGDPILKKCGSRDYNRVVVLLWKLEQLVTLNNRDGWKLMINKFTSCVGDVFKANADLNELLAYDLVRMEMDIWNRQLFKMGNVQDLNKLNSETVATAKLFMTRAIQTGNLCFTKFSLNLNVFLLNNSQWKVIKDTMDHRCFKTTFTDFARLLATHFQCVFETGEKAKAAQLANDVLWKVLWPTFEASNQGASRTGPTLLTKHQLHDFLLLLKEPHCLDFFFGYTAFLFNSVLAVATEQDKPTIPAPYRSIYTEHTVMWNPAPFDAKSLDFDFIEKTLEILCANAMLVSPINPSWLRICGDFSYVRERWNDAATYYLEVIAAFQHGVPMDPVYLDVIYMKLAVCLVHLKMPTLAAIVGQFMSNIEPHLEMVEWLLQGTHNTVDAGPAYFSLIADMTLMERMAAAYTKMGLTIYLQNLIKSMPTKAINPNNAPHVLEREVDRRKKRFLGILFNQFFKQNM